MTQLKPMKYKVFMRGQYQSPDRWVWCQHDRFGVWKMVETGTYMPPPSEDRIDRQSGVELI